MAARLWFLSKLRKTRKNYNVSREHVYPVPDTPTARFVLRTEASWNNGRHCSSSIFSVVETVLDQIVRSVQRATGFNEFRMRTRNR